MAGIYGWIKNIVIYMILNTIINNLLGKTSYKKYVSLVSGMILVLIVIVPITKLLKIEDITNNLFDFNQLAVEVSDFKNNIISIENDEYNNLFLELEENIIENIRNMLMEDGLYLINCKVMLNEEYGSDSFGNITYIKLEASTKENQINKVEKIEKIVISENSTKDFISPQEIIIKDKLSDFYNLDKDNINVIIRGE